MEAESMPIYNRIGKKKKVISLVSWSSATDDQIIDMVNGYYAGKVSLTDIKSVWSVGDTRTITLAGMPAIGVSDMHRTQTIELQILDFEHDDLLTPVNGKNKALITVDLKDCLRDDSVSDTTGSSNTENGYINNSNTNAGGWRNCSRRTWCNETFYNALPTYVKDLVRKVRKKTSAGSKSAAINTDYDMCFLLSEVEIFGSTTYSAGGEGSQYPWYSTITNRYKLPKWNTGNESAAWWGRSPGINA
jgi:hypothetical protein